MRFILNAIFFFGLLTISSMASAAENDNFCGSGITNYIVPDNLFGCRLAGACKVHDICYSKCNPGGEKYGTPYCGNSEFSEERRAAKLQCDVELKNNIIELNLGEKRCAFVASIYLRAVKKFGQIPFNGLVVDSEILDEIIQKSASDEQAADIWETIQTAQINKAIYADKIRIEGTSILIPLQPNVNSSIKLTTDGLLRIPTRPSKELLQDVQSLGGG
jgi:hypothetical protein